MKRRNLVTKSLVDTKPEPDVPAGKESDGRGRKGFEHVGGIAHVHRPDLEGNGFLHTVILHLVQHPIVLGHLRNVGVQQHHVSSRGGMCVVLARVLGQIVLIKHDGVDEVPENADL